MIRAKGAQLSRIIFLLFRPKFETFSGWGNDGRNIVPIVSIAKHNNGPPVACLICDLARKDISFNQFHRDCTFFNIVKKSLRCLTEFLPGHYSPSHVIVVSYALKYSCHRGKLRSFTSVAFASIMKEYFFESQEG